MAKRRAKKMIKKNESVPDNPDFPQIEAQIAQFIGVERQIAAIRAVRVVWIDHLLAELRLLRSDFNKEQLQKPVLQVFEETLPNLSIVKDKDNEENKKSEVRWKRKRQYIVHQRR